MIDKEKIMSAYDEVYKAGYEAGRKSVVLPHPCNGPLYDNWTPPEYLKKMKEEYKEIVNAFKDLELSIGDTEDIKELRKHLFWECVDLQTITVSFMEMLGCKEEERQQITREVNESNATRDGGKRIRAVEPKPEEHSDAVHHPQHYEMPGGIEVIDMIKNTLGHDGFLAYCQGNILKYICRYRMKNGREDLQKAITYAAFMIEEIDREKKAKES